ncbi:GntR family transcriptional regulator [Paenibacillus sambharensis]|uniref:GntR family transcriptional regulator n=1 Tax=Paenibacillus sambharensis TaxID=1803190 RepID=A0A2W1LJV8_9BACL|nr:GntR family transcriptional regulator [Paenibacillus sambharensis]PZD95292.1 GntR family transcriptional regulator [Paenibacillus sambharensis]
MGSKTKYTIVKEKITEWIRTGRVKPGDKIYSEHELVRLFGVSRHTVRQAVGDLVHEGWLYRERGAGTFCSGKSGLPLERLTTEQAEQSLLLPSAPARKTIGVITTYISDYIFPTIIKGIESYLTSHGYSLTLACTDNDAGKERLCLESMLSQNIAGLIVEPTKSSSFNPNMKIYLELEQRSIPYLMINQFYPQLMPSHMVVDDERGGFLVTEHLIKLGHKKIIGIFKVDDLQGISRMRGFIRALRKHRLPVFPDMIVSYTTEEQDDGHILAKLRDFFPLSSPGAHTAAVCYNDQIALHVLDMLRNQGLRVPEEFSITGYDDSYLAEATEVKLTTVTHPKTLMGIEAARWIVNAVENRNSQEGAVVYEPQLVIRSSTAPPKEMSAVHFS